MHIGELAKRSGVSTATIRHYERIGLLPHADRTPAGYRMYAEPVVERVRLIQNALRFGFSLRQLIAFLRVRHAGGAPCRNVRAAGAQILEAIEREIAALIASRESIKETLKLWDQRLAQTPEGAPALLLESLPVGSGSSAAGRGRLVSKRYQK